MDMTTLRERDIADFLCDSKGRAVDSTLCQISPGLVEVCALDTYARMNGDCQIHTVHKWIRFVVRPGLLG